MEKNVFWVRPEVWEEDRKRGGKWERSRVEEATVGEQDVAKFSKNKVRLSVKREKKLDWWNNSGGMCEAADLVFRIFKNNTVKF